MSGWMEHQLGVFERGAEVDEEVADEGGGRRREVHRTKLLHVDCLQLSVLVQQPPREVLVAASSAVACSIMYTNRQQKANKYNTIQYNKIQYNTIQ